MGDYSERNEQRRRRAIRLIYGPKKLSQYKVAQQLGVTREAVSKWVEAYEARGAQGLKPSTTPRGRKPAVTDEQLRELAAEGKRRGLTTLTELLALAKERGHQIVRSPLRTRLIRLGLWPRGEADPPPKRR